MKSKEQLIAESMKTVEYISRLTKAQEDKLVRILLYGTYRRFYEDDLYKTATKPDALIREWKTRQSRRLAIVFLKDMVNHGLLSTIIDRSNLRTMYYTPPDVILDLILGTIYSQPIVQQKVFFRDTIRMVRTLKRQKNLANSVLNQKRLEAIYKPVLDSEMPLTIQTVGMALGSNKQLADAIK